MEQSEGRIIPENYLSDLFSNFKGEGKVISCEQFSLVYI